MIDEFAWVYCLNRITATITKQMTHDFDLKKIKMTKLKSKVSCAKMLRKLIYSLIRIYYVIGQSTDRTKAYLKG
jgi:hypothetical protein